MEEFLKSLLPQGVEVHNAVTYKNLEIPSYDTTKVQRSIHLYFNNDGDVIIEGRVKTYTFWLSVTKTDELELNEEIFNHIANEDYNYVTQFHTALAAKNLKPADLVNYYMVSLTRSKVKDMEWETPFGNYYGTKQIKRNGWFFARDVKAFSGETNKLCELRECDGKYEMVLEDYAQALRNASEYDYTVQALEKLLKQEEYLCLSRRENVRALYLECCRKCAELYGQYMTQAR